MTQPATELTVQVRRTTTVIPPQIPRDLQPMYCPRCDRLKDNLEAVKTHVELRHPDHDPEWFETYPESFGN